MGVNVFEVIMVCQLLGINIFFFIFFSFSRFVLRVILNREFALWDLATIYPSEGLMHWNNSLVQFIKYKRFPALHLDVSFDPRC